VFSGFQLTPLRQFQPGFSGRPDPSLAAKSIQHTNLKPLKASLKNSHFPHVFSRFSLTFSRFFPFSLTPFSEFPTTFFPLTHCTTITCKSMPYFSEFRFSVLPHNGVLPQAKTLKALPRRQIHKSLLKWSIDHFIPLYTAFNRPRSSREFPAASPEIHAGVLRKAQNSMLNTAQRC
jgi:hypothetical protein